MRTEGGHRDGPPGSDFPGPGAAGEAGRERELPRRGGDLVLVKLGGSLITEKGGDARARPGVLRRLARELADAAGSDRWRVILGHGSGSFGHPPAAQYHLREGLHEPAQYDALSLTQSRAAQLHRLVVTELRDAGLRVFSVPPSAAAVAREGRVREFATGPLCLALEQGFFPVVYGDVLLDEVRGATIGSTEDVLVHLASVLPARGWRVRRALWMGNTAGVYDASGAVMAELRAGEEGVERARKAVGGAGTTDATGGMAHRLEAALELARGGIPSWIGDGGRPGALRRELLGHREPGTRVLPPS